MGGRSCVCVCVCVCVRACVCVCVCVRARAWAWARARGLKCGVPGLHTEVVRSSCRSRQLVQTRPPPPPVWPQVVSSLCRVIKNPNLEVGGARVDATWR